MITTSANKPSPLADAFLNQYNLILLGGAAAFAAALGTPLPIFAGLCAEGLWLFLATQVPELREQARAHRAHVTASQPGAVNAPVGRLLGGGGLGASAQVAADLTVFSERLRAQGHPAYATWDVKLQSVLATYQQLSAQHARATAALGALQSASGGQSAESLERALSETQDAASRMALRRALSLAQRRAHELVALDQELLALDERLARISESVHRLPTLPASAWDGLPAWLDELAALAPRAAEPRELMSGRASVPAVRVTGTYFTDPEK